MILSKQIIFRTLTLLVTLVVVSLFVVSCKKQTTTIPVSGCMDPDASNYNAAANVSTQCTYGITRLLGTYRVTDTMFKQSSLGQYLTDTIIINTDVTVCSLSKKMIVFDTVLSYRNVSEGTSCISPDFTHYQLLVPDRPGHYYGGYSINAYFIGDSLRYRIFSNQGNFHERRGVGVKL